MLLSCKWIKIGWKCGLLFYVKSFFVKRKKSVKSDLFFSLSKLKIVTIKILKLFPNHKYSKLNMTLACTFTVTKMGPFTIRARIVAKRRVSTPLRQKTYRKASSVVVVVGENMHKASKTSIVKSKALFFSFT